MKKIFAKIHDEQKIKFLNKQKKKNVYHRIINSYWVP